MTVVVAVAVLVTIEVEVDAGAVSVIVVWAALAPVNVVTAVLTVFWNIVSARYLEHGCRLTVTVLVDAERVVVALVEAVYVLVLVTMAFTSVAQIVDVGYMLGEAVTFPSLPTLIWPSACARAWRPGLSLPNISGLISCNDLFLGR